MRVLPESSFSVAPELLEDLDPTSLPPIQTEQVIDRVPRSLHSLFEPEGTRDQPHLDHLRERKRKLEEAFASGDLSLSEDAPMIIQEAKYRRKSSNQGLLSDAEKKANHIASEQKRRANIRKGYDMLASVLPSLERSTIEESRVSADEMGGENRSAAYSEIAVLLEGMLLRTSVCHFYSHLFLSPFSTRSPIPTTLLEFRILIQQLRSTYSVVYKNTIVCSLTKINYSIKYSPITKPVRSHPVEKVYRKCRSQCEGRAVA